MNKKMQIGWFYVALGSMLISLISLFLPIFVCKTFEGTKTFNVLDLVNSNSDFKEYVIGGYYGPVVLDLKTGEVTILVIIGLLALLCAVIGLVTLKAQRPNTINFILTIIGLIGISIPSLIAIICVVKYGEYYIYGLSLGIAPIISPIAIIISIGAVIRRKNKVAEEIKKEMEQKGVIRKANDLDL